MIDSWPAERWVPDSCCKSFELNCGKTGEADLWYSNGCSEQVLMWFIQRLHIVGVVGLAVAFIQVIKEPMSALKPQNRVPVKRLVFVAALRFDLFDAAVLHRQVQEDVADVQVLRHDALRRRPLLRENLVTRVRSTTHTAVVHLVICFVIPLLVFSSWLCRGDMVVKEVL